MLLQCDTIGEGTHSTNQRRHTYVRDNVEVGFFTDPTVCIGCKACEVACKEWNQVPMTASFGRAILTTTPAILARPRGVTSCLSSKTGKKGPDRRLAFVS